MPIVQLALLNSFCTLDPQKSHSVASSRFFHIQNTKPVSLSLCGQIIFIFSLSCAHALENGVHVLKLVLFLFKLLAFQCQFSMISS